MAENYWKKDNVEEKSFIDLAEDDDFIADSIAFLMSSRRNFSGEDINDMSKRDIVDEIIEHKRQTSTAGNEISLLKDVSYMNSQDKKDEASKDSYSRLSYAWENSKEAGDSMLQKAGDYAAGMAASPSILGGVLSAPLTMGSGFIAGQAAKTGGMALFNSLVRKRLFKNMMITGGVEGVAAGGREYMAQTVQNKAEDRLGVEYDGERVNIPLLGEVREDTLKRTATATGLGFGLGAATTGVFGHLVNRGARKTFESLEEGYRVTKEAVRVGTEKAKSKIAKTDSKMINAVERQLAALDPERVAEGVKIKDAILGNYADTSREVVKDFNANQLQRIAAAAIEISEELGVKLTKGITLKSGVKVGDNETTLRITDAVADLLEKESIEGPTHKLLNRIKEKYQLSNKQLSAIFAAEFSQAGRILSVASRLSRSVAKEEIDRLTGSAIKIANNDVPVPTKEEIQSLQSVLDATDSKSLASRFYRGARSLTDSRVAFMTSQVATTARNTTFGGMYIMLDAMDTAFSGALKIRDFNTLKKAFTQPLKVINRLAFNRTEAEAAVYQLSEQFPEEIRRLLSKQGLIEAEGGANIQSSALMRLSTKLNFLNAFSDNQFKRAVLIGNLDRRLAEAGNKAVGTSVRDVLRKNTWNKIDKNIVLKSIDEAYNKSFQTQFGQVGEGGASQLTGSVIKGIKASVVGTLIIPFPRFIASQAKFIAEYTPFYSIVGRPLFEAGKKKVINPATGKPMAKAFSASTWEENLGKEISGFLILGAGYYKAYHGVPEGYEWNRAENPSNKANMNIQAILGPMALQFWAMDKLYRLRHGMPLPEGATMWREVKQLTLGADLRAQNSLTAVIQGAEDYALKGDANQLAKAFTDIGASFTYPAAVLKDVYGQFDPRSAYLPETKDATVNVLDFMGLDQKTVMRATRFLPDVPSINGYDPKRYDIFTEHALYIKDPILKQFIGIEMQPEKSMLDKEFARLAIDKYQLYPVYQKKNDYLDILTRMYGSTEIAKPLYRWTKTDKNYLTANDTLKKDLLEQEARDRITKLRAGIVRYFESSVKGTKDEDYLFYLRGKLRDPNTIEKKVRRQLESETNYGATIEEMLARAKAMDKVKGEGTHENEILFIYKAIQDSRKIKETFKMIRDQ